MTDVILTVPEALAILNLSAPYSDSDVKSAYLRRSRLYHPDRHAGASASEARLLHEEFIRITTARDVLLAAPYGGPAAAPRSSDPTTTSPAPPPQAQENATPPPGSAPSSKRSAMREQQFTEWRDAQAFPRIRPSTASHSAPPDPRGAERQSPRHRPSAERRTERALVLQLQAHLEKRDPGHWYTPVTLPCHLANENHLGLAVLAGDGIVGIHLCTDRFWGTPLSVQQVNALAGDALDSTYSGLGGLPPTRQGLGPLRPSGLARLTDVIIREPSKIRVGETVDRIGDTVTPR